MQFGKYGRYQVLIFNSVKIRESGEAVLGTQL